MGHYSFFETILGRLVLLEEDGFLCGLYFEDQGLSYEGYTYQKDLTVFEKSEKWLKDYFDGRIPEEVPPLRFKGTKFQKEVWQALMKIPYGETLRYKDLAKQIAEDRGIKKMSAQAVGQAAGKNRILLLVPCHRLIGSDGSLT
ncbi:MAG: methylated-DNA--[Erysipelotrichaceae bacterium]|nr:methylated-DNA--[protein]-cysteine S-methyltransferase [Erysipelotrichaceae bacterium]